MSVKDWFHDTYGKFSGEEGAAILELLLLRREVAIAQLNLLRKRRKSGTDPLARIEIAEGVKAILNAKAA